MQIYLEKERESLEKSLRVFRKGKTKGKSNRSKLINFRKIVKKSFSNAESERERKSCDNRRELMS